MSDHTKDCCVYNVACDVSNCAYNADGKRCHADHIQVKNTQGTCTCKDETFCSTFTKKGSAAFCPGGRVSPSVTYYFRNSSTVCSICD